ncbi:MULTISPECIES: hypothetical protein [unclassified Rhodococcus (in: high G+C Gram-positive bacteria)]|jgi:uncharacterized membrane protein HdeD (DUF308 family)|uniref:hypothetical protein n=1 Tax=unclassified Rhodococcus (in: high G+C Gram-positive bacteria) TaxID=192944 RepID=UPI00146A6CA0|nr:MULTISPECIES: hypothetical protein [unclassified Rhodococcus (in: high G+C Gram-positive bacteria)]MBF0660993.1 hypothetical protein [Rhodococcus sp. (in: high G+C Gram-positive bacteria)]NMD94094.1 hypothetical protein [Rhodococcus sp. BL-253-APC-6A1W]NME77660.1 hypothetical protein [Rhodococcus sp. 105337]
MTNTSRHEPPTTGSRVAGWIGYACVLASIAVVAMALFAAGDGFAGWTVVAVVIAAALLSAGAALITINFRHRRLHGSGGTPTHEPGVLD